MNQPANVAPWFADRPTQGTGQTTGVPRGPMAGRVMIASDAAARLVFPADPRRGYLLLQNNSGANMIVGLDAEPDANSGLILGPGVFWEPQFVPTNAIYILGTLPTQQGYALVITL